MKLTERKARKRPGLKPVYRLSELADLLGQSKKATRRLLARHGVTITHGGAGTPSMVTLLALQEAMPELWQSILIVRAMG